MIFRFMHLSGRIASLLAKLVLLEMAWDMLMRKRTEQQTKMLVKREAQSRINEFLNIASHELKTPLTSIKGNVQLMERKLRNQKGANISPEEAKKVLAEAQELLERTNHQITRLTRLVNGLIEGARIHGNTMDLLFELGDLRHILQEVLQNERYLPKGRNINTSTPEESLLIMADVSRVKQVIIHLLSNAHKYSPAEYAVEITLQQVDGKARMAVRDEGPGIKQEEQQRIWERFYRASGIEVLNGSEVGLGLGLHISRTIIEQHHGQIGVQSKPGAGSTFWFTLPLFNEHESIA